MHTTHNKFNDSQNHEMNTDDMIAFLEHLDSCDFCLNQMIQEQEENLPAAPSYLKQQILEKSSSLEVRAEKSAVETSRKIQLFYAGLRTAAGVVMALFLLLCIGQTDYTAFHHEPPVPAEITAETKQPRHPKNPLHDLSISITQGLSEGSDKISGYLNDISNKIVNGGK